ncbi:hypothetical protein LPJ66_000821 [Kickxella alabastrina]|uniref:Uncharacterized protein n=1 Tax=Kickxella alabastrina TaxID=61397 RepID=A0ACC1IV27_9FUNG|nr:hypothetical protein LPJ66_000821 [Kickxella alabastrina]
MSNLYKQTAGAIKDTIGSMVGNKDLVDKDREQWAEGEGKQNMQETQARREDENPNMHRAGDSASDVSGASKEKVGQAIGNKSMEAEGHSQCAQAKGNAAYHKLAKDNVRAGF